MTSVPPAPSIDLRGKRALVTGAGRRVGAAIAVALGGEGMRVAVHHRASASGALQTCAAVREAGGEAVSVPGDLGDRGAARALLDEAVSALGGLDLLVCSAGSFERGDLEHTDDGNWDRTLALNLTAPFVLAQRAAPALRATRGSIVMVTCVSRLAPYRGYLAYETSKAALHHLMRLLALELAPDVRVNAVAPGSVLPPDSWTDAQRAELEQRIPLGRLGSAEDVAGAVVHLAQSDWITGAEIIVDGGRSLG
jgi:pteridine reductase